MGSVTIPTKGLWESCRSCVAKPLLAGPAGDDQGKGHPGQEEQRHADAARQLARAIAEDDPEHQCRDGGHGHGEDAESGFGKLVPGQDETP